MSNIREQFGKKLRQVRKDRNLSQERLAELAGISKDQISCLERGKSSTSLDRLAKLADVLGVSAKDLLDFQ